MKDTTFQNSVDFLTDAIKLIADGADVDKALRTKFLVKILEPSMNMAYNAAYLFGEGGDEYDIVCDTSVNNGEVDEQDATILIYRLRTYRELDAMMADAKKACAFEVHISLGTGIGMIIGDLLARNPIDDADKFAKAIFEVAMKYEDMDLGVNRMAILKALLFAHDLLDAFGRYMLEGGLAKEDEARYNAAGETHDAIVNKMDEYAEKYPEFFKTDEDADDPKPPCNHDCATCEHCGGDGNEA